jgi:tetratricopeptide (TPR) repeat protein
MNDLNNSVQSILKSAAGSFLASDYTSALEELKKGEVLDKDNPEILYNLGIAYTRLGLFKQPVNIFTGHYAKIPFIDLLHVKKNIAFCMINLCQFDEA